MKDPDSRFITLCGRIFQDTDADFFPNGTWHGRRIYFCTQVCLEAFLADPEPFYRAHRNSEKTKGPILAGEPTHVE